MVQKRIGLEAQERQEWVDVEKPGEARVGIGGVKRDGAI